MSVLSKEMEAVINSQGAHAAQCAAYFYNGHDGAELSAFDSVHTAPEKRPELLQACFDSIDSEHHNAIDGAVKWGIQAYQYKNGGDLPHPSLIAAALAAGSQVAKSNFSALSNSIAGFDDISNLHYEQAAIVPAMTVVTIANVIAGTPSIMAMLPNNTQSVRVPVAALRFTTDSSFGAMKQGEYLDGVKAAAPYAEGRFRYALSNGGAGAVYTVVAHTEYLDFAAKTTDTTAALLPFWSGLISVRVNGVEIANTFEDRLRSVEKGTLTVVAKPAGITIAGTLYKVVDSLINVDTSEISITLNAALPVGAKLEVALVANYDVRTTDRKSHKINPVGVSMEFEYDSVTAAPVNMRINASYNLQSQLSNELGLGFVGAALTIMQQKFYLEQTVRLLKEAKERAEQNGRGYFDASRGVTGNLTFAANSTGDLIGEALKVIALGKMRIQQASGGVTTAFSLYVGDIGAIFFNQLSGDKFTRTGLLAGYGEIVRIGTLSDGTDVYHTPTNQGVVLEDGTARTTEMLLIGRGNEPARNPFVGHIPTPLTIREAKPDGRDVVMDILGVVAAELNPLERYANQVAVIQMVNLPSLRFDPPVN